MATQEVRLMEAPPPQEARAALHPLSFTPYPFSVARFLLVAALVAVPWAFGGTVAWVWVSLGLVACAILFLWAWGSVQQRVLQLAGSPVFLPVGLFLVMGVVQYMARLTLDRAETRQALVLLATDVVLFFLTVQLFSRVSRETWRAFGFAVLLLAGSLGVFAMLEFAAGEQQVYGEFPTLGTAPFGPYANPNHFAGLMEMLIPVAVLSLAERRGKPSLATLAWLAVGAAIPVAALLLSGSRGGLLALGAEVAIAIPVVARSSRLRRQHIEKSRSLAAAVATAILAAVLLFTWVDPGFVAQKLGLIVKVGGPAWAEWAGFRKKVASDSLRMLRDHPIVGVGLGNFETAYPPYQSFPSDLWIDYAHNDYVQAVAEADCEKSYARTGILSANMLARKREQESRSRTKAGWMQLVQIGATH